MSDRMRILALAGVIFGCAGGPQASDANAPSERLPATVVPSQYELELHPDADKLSFTAQVAIDVRVLAPTAEFVLNAKGLELDSVFLDARTQAKVTLDEKLEHVTLHFPGPVGAGPHTLRIKYHGPITRGTLGFFAMDYDSAAGKRRDATLCVRMEQTAVSHGRRID